MTTSSTPHSLRRFRQLPRIGTPLTGRSGFGWMSVNPPSRRPAPAARMMAFRAPSRLATRFFPIPSAISASRPYRVGRAPAEGLTSQNSDAVPPTLPCQVSRRELVPDHEPVWRLDQGGSRSGARRVDSVQLDYTQVAPVFRISKFIKKQPDTSRMPLHERRSKKPPPVPASKPPSGRHLLR